MRVRPGDPKYDEILRRANASPRNLKLRPASGGTASAVAIGGGTQGASPSSLILEGEDCFEGGGSGWQGLEIEEAGRSAKKRGAKVFEERPASSAVSFQRSLGKFPALGGNNLERRFYREFLAPRLQSGELKLVLFEPFALRLTPAINRSDFASSEQQKRFPAMTYTPDFLAAGEVIEVHEVKGPYEREDSWVKFKLAVSRYPFFRWVKNQMSQGGKWECYVAEANEGEEPEEVSE